MHTTAEFALTPQDFTRLQRIAVRRLRRLGGIRGVDIVVKIVLWLLLAGMFFLFFRLHDLHPADSASFDALGGLAALAFLLALFRPYITQALLRRRVIAANGSFLQPHVLQFTDEGVAYRSATNQGQTAWSGFVGSDRDDANHYLFVDACSAFVVPRAAVADFQSAFDLCVARIPAA